MATGYYADAGSGYDGPVETQYYNPQSGNYGSGQSIIDSANSIGGGNYSDVDSALNYYKTYAPDQNWQNNTPKYLSADQNQLNLTPYDTSQYSSPELAYLDNFNNWGGQSKGVSQYVQQLGLDPRAVINGLQKWQAGGQGNTTDWLGSPQAMLYAAGQGDPSLASKINPWFQQQQNQDQFNQHQQQGGIDWQRAHPAMEMHTNDYMDILKGMALVASMGAAGGAFAGGEALGAGAEGYGVAGGADALDSSLASSAWNPTWGDALDSSLASTGTTGLGQGVSEGAGIAGGVGGTVGEGSGGGNGGSGGTPMDAGTFNSGSGFNGPMPDTGPQTLADLQNFEVGTSPLSSSSLEGGASTGQILPENGAQGTNMFDGDTLDSSLYNGNDPYARPDVIGSDWSGGQPGSLQSNTNPGMMDQLKSLYQQVNGFTKTPYYQVPKTMMDVYGQYQNGQNSKAAMDRYNQQSDPFGAQRAQYQAMLAQSYNDPKSLYNSPQYQSLRDIFSKQISAKDAAAGRNSQYGARSLQMQDNFNSYLNQYRAGLQGAAGANIAPNMSGLQSIYQNSGNANKAMLTSLANPQLWQSLFG